MDEGSDALFDALLALRMDWESVIAEYGRHGARLCDLLVADRGLPARTARELASDVMVHAIAVEQLTRCMDQVDELLQDEEHRRVFRFQPAPATYPQGSPPVGEALP